jgi:hypothetical protein
LRSLATLGTASPGVGRTLSILASAIKLGVRLSVCFPTKT